MLLKFTKRFFLSPIHLFLSTSMQRNWELLCMAT